jgi:hypothetical protein
VASPRANAVEVFLDSWREHGFGGPGSAPVQEHRFTSARLWRLDIAWPCQWVAVEVHGYGRHYTLKGFREDREKINTAQLLGWRVLEYEAAWLRSHSLEAAWDVCEAMQLRTGFEPVDA